MDLFFLWIGVLFLAVVLIVIVLDDLRFIRPGRVMAQGTVFDHSLSNDADGPSYAVNVRFKDRSGREVEITDTVGRSQPYPPIGTVVTIVYPADAPEKGGVRRPLLRLPA